MAGTGRPYPGASIRLREGESWTSNGDGTATYAGMWKSENGDTPIGAIGGLRGGLGTLRIGDRKSSGFTGEIAGEAYLNLAPWFSAGLALGHEYAHGEMPSGTRDDGGADIRWGRWFTMAMAQFVPLRPFILRAGVGVHTGGVTVDEKDAFDTSGTMASLGVGMTFPFLGLHFVAVVDHRRSWSGAADFGNGVTGDLRSDGWIGTMWVLF